MQDATAQRVIAADRVRLPGPLIRQLMALDPVTDPDWHSQAQGILSQLGKAEQKYAYYQYLEPKGIRYEPEEKRFVHIPSHTLEDAAAGITHAELRQIASRLFEALEAMRGCSDPVEFADHMEGALGLLRQFDSEEDLKVQKEKNLLRNAFLTRLVHETEAADLAAPKNYRGLTADHVKRFIIEVFLKHEFLGYRFRTLPVNTLEDDEHSFIREVVAPEARVRQCDIIRTHNSIYLIAPVESSAENPYSVRRFLQEEVVIGSSIYFNGVVIPTSHRLLDDEKNRKALHFIITRMVTLQRRLSTNIVELVEQLWAVHHELLAPMLRRPIEANGRPVEEAVANRIAMFEQDVETKVLREIYKGMRTVATTPDDLEYLFISLRRLLIQLAGEMRDFMMHTVARWSVEAESLDLRLISMLQLLDKLNRPIFTTLKADDTGTAKRIELLNRELKGLLQKHEEREAALKHDLERVVARQERRTRFYRRWFDRVAALFRKPPDPEALRQQIRENRFNCFIEIIRKQKRSRDISVYLEFEDVTPITDGVRHYAIAQGAEGVSRLPVMLRLSEEMETFDIAALKRAFPKV